MTALLELEPLDHEQRQQALETFEELCPNIIGNPYVPHFPHPKQAQFLGAHPRPDPSDGPPFECLYGGAAGGGKSDALLMAAAQYAWKYPHFQGLLLRRTYAELAKAGALMTRAMGWWTRSLGVHWNGTDKVFTFPNGATVEMGYHANIRDDDQYQGAEYHLVGFDELTHWPDDRAFDWLKSRVRKGDGDPIPRRLLATSNPGGPGHVWVRDRFVGGVDMVAGRRFEGRSLYIPATLKDNPSLNREAYRATLSEMHPTVRRQLLEGDWEARDPGDYFRLEWFGPLLDPVLDEIPRGDRVMVRWWDLAASERDDAARTAGVLMARTRLGARAVVHATAFRATPGKRDGKIAQQAHLDGRHVVVGLEIEGGSGGPAQFETLSKRLRAQGFRVVGARPRTPQHTETEKRVMIRTPTSVTAKAARADPVASCLERGYQRRGECDETGEPWWGVDAGRGFLQEREGLRLYAGPWTQAYLDELEGFPDVALLDQVDATSGAWAWLEAHPFGMRHAPGGPAAGCGPAEMQQLHPDDRPDDPDAQDAAGRWRP